ncbi:MAG: hypothetical protein E7070_10530 [Bacteroidales bacterium]|nr:hypothetical protein [Bacteroidales bacterium]
MEKSTLIRNLPNLIFSLILLLVTSCSSSNSELQDGFPKEYTLHGDSVSTQANIYVRYYINFADGHVIIPSPKNHTDTLLHIYSTPDLNLRLATGIKGHGKTEFQDTPHICHSTSGGLYIKGYTPNTLRKVHITDSALVDIEHFKLYTSGAPNHMHIVEDSLLYFTNFGKTTKIVSYNINKQTVVNEFAIQNLYKSKGHSLHGCLCVNNHFAIYAMQYKREIAIFKTSDLSYVKTVKREYENQDDAIENNSDDYMLYYTGSFATQDKFYLLYRGFKKRSSSKNCDIEVYDKDMKPICLYHLEPEINRFVTDEKNGYIYGLGSNSDYIYRFKMPI